MATPAAALKERRLKSGLTQAEMARRLGVTQAYVSMLERGRRPVAHAMRDHVVRGYGLGPSALALSGDTSPLPSDEVAKSLAALHYEPFGYLRGRRLNPAEVLLRALRHDDLDARVAEALPWVLLHYPDLDWDWLAREAKLADLQNRVGFLVTLARQAAQRTDSALADRLRAREAALEPSRLAREDTFCRAALTDVERRWLRSNRSEDAAHWNLLTGLRAEHLRYAA